MTLALTLATPPSLAVKSGAPRTQAIDMVVLHSTGGPACDAASGRPVWVKAGTLRANLRFIEAHPKLGIHYMIDRDGSVHASVPEDRLAHHVLKFSGRSIAIELINDGDGKDPFPVAQVDAVVELLRGIVQRRGIVRSGIQRHSDLDHSVLPCAPHHRRKVDPGDAFPFAELLGRVFAPR